MSDEFDMKNYAGEIDDSAAVSQSNETNSYQQEVIDEFKVPELPQASESTPELPVTNQVEEQLSKQELNFKALREEVDRIKAERESERRDHQLQLDMLRANAQRQPESAPAPKMFEGMEETDVPNVREIRRAWEQRETEYQSRIEELQVAQTHPDYAEVIEKFALPLVKQKPHLAEGIQGAKNKALFAYELGKMAQQMQQAQQSVQQSSAPVVPTPQKSADAQRIVENSRKPGTLSQAGGQGALSKADYYASMSDQEFLKVASGYLDQI